MMNEQYMYEQQTSQLNNGKYISLCVEYTQDLDESDIDNIYNIVI